ncbi:MAG: Fe(2+) transporter permease subunit FeoB [Pseudomonadota bacterium]
MTRSDRPFVIGLVGNPNCGKTTLFNALTGSKQKVGNWPGVTVERKEGEYIHQHRRVSVVDLPGTYSLDVVDLAVSLDEKVARDFVHAKEASLLVNIVDASNLERNFYLTMQLSEMGVPMVLALNMSDVALSKGLLVNAEQLSRQLGVPVIEVVASSGKGIEALKYAIEEAVDHPVVPHVKVDYPEALTQAIDQLELSLVEIMPQLAQDASWLCVRLLEGDELAHAMVPVDVSKLARQMAADLGGDVDIWVADARYRAAHELVQASVTEVGKVSKDITEQIDRWVLNRWLGIPIFLVFMYLMFLFTINIGGAFIDFFDLAVGALLVDGLGQWMSSLGSPDWLVVLLANGVGGGIQTVATFIPVIGFLYLFLSVLEDSGYMARAAFVMDRFMRWLGLPGKSFVPLIVGFGCNVPAIMATRTLEHQKDRLLTIAMAPFMSCGARLPVYVLFAAAFFSSNAQNVVFGLYLAGIALAVVTGLLLRNTLFQGEATPFIMELPSYHVPSFKGIVIHTWHRLKGFVVNAGQLIVPMVLVLNVLSSTGTDGSFGNDNTDRSVLSSIGRLIAPAFSPLGLNEDNWPAAVGIFTGVLAKEALVGTLDATYTALAQSDAKEAAQALGQTLPEPPPFVLSAALTEAVDSIPNNLADALGSWADPLGLSAVDASDQESVAQEHDVSSDTFGAMAARFDGAAGAMAYLLFILLYMPCTAAIASVYQESGWRWTLFVGWWTTGLAYGVSTLYYQISTYVWHPQSTWMWVGVIASIYLLVWLFLKHAGRTIFRVNPS